MSTLPLDPFIADDDDLAFAAHTLREQVQALVDDLAVVIGQNPVRHVRTLIGWTAHGLATMREVVEALAALDDPLALDTSLDVRATVAAYIDSLKGR